MGTGVESSIEEEKEQVVVRETKLPVVETVVQESTQLPALPELEQTSSKEIKADAEATSQAESRNENMASDAGPTEQEHVVLAGELETIKQPVMQEMVITETLQQSSDLQKKATDGEEHIGEGNGSGETNPEHAVTFGSERNGEGSEDSVDEGSLPGNEGDSNVGGQRDSHARSAIIKIKKEQYV